MKYHEPYNLRFNHLPDFLVEYEILTEAQGGRKAPVHQGIRWDLWYQDEGHVGNYTFMVWPEFIDDDGNVIIQREAPIPKKGKAILWIINEHMRAYHQERIVAGMKCYAREGSRIVANYRVAKILGLMTNPIVKNMED